MTKLVQNNRNHYKTKDYDELKLYVKSVSSIRIRLISKIIAGNLQNK